MTLKYFQDSQKENIMGDLGQVTERVTQSFREAPLIA